jgi:hypothetical protein
MRLPSELKKPLADGRLLVLSPFASSGRRASKELAAQRNRFVAALADEIIFAYIAPSGYLDELSQLVAGWRIPTPTPRSGRDRLAKTTCLVHGKQHGQDN